MNHKLFVGLVALALVFGLGLTAFKASAQTMEEFMAEFAKFQQQLQQWMSSQGGGSGAGCGFTRDLSEGSSGADVTCLQNYLTKTGHFTVSATGFFGPITKAAVSAWQAANGVSPATGYFGPISRAKYNSLVMGMGGSGGQTGCPLGQYDPLTGKPCGQGSTVPGCQPGDKFSRTTGQACDGTTPPPSQGFVPDGTDGSITIASSALVSSGTVVKKGETRNVVSRRIKATNGPVSVNRVDVKFSERPWLTISKVALKDGSGNVLAEKMLNGPGDVTEVTVGSDYRVRFDNVSLVVKPGTDVDLLVSVSVLASSDKITGQTITTGITEIRTTNGIGFSETKPDSATFTFILPTSGSVADIYTSISSNSPLAGIQQVAAGTTVTENVVLARYRIKAQNTSATLNSVDVGLNTSGTDAAALYSNVRLHAGGMNYGASAMGTTTEFRNMEVPLPLDQWVEFTLTANVAGAAVSGGTSASTTLVATSIRGIDANFNSVNVIGSNVISADRLFLETGVAVSSASAALGNCPGENPTSCGAIFNFTLTNTGNNTAYISKTVGVLFATSTVPAGVASSTITALTANPADDAGDTSASYAIQSGGSRAFTANGTVSQAAGTKGVHQLRITRIYFGSNPAAGAQGEANKNASNFITSGLGNLVVTANF